MSRRTRVLLPLGLTLLAVLVAIPAAITLTPARQTTVAGQYLGVGGVTPLGGWLGGWRGPAQLEQIGETTVDVPPVQVRGPLRPKLELGPLVRTRDVDELLDPHDGPKARSAAVAAITTAFRDWFVLATLLVVLITLAVLATITTIRIWTVMARASRHQAHLTVGEVWLHQARTLRLGALIALAGTLAVWAGVGLLAWHDTAAGIDGISSPRDLVGAAPLKLEPAGAPVAGFAGAVIGDSRASRLGGPPVESEDPDDVACSRSTDSLAAELTRFDPAAPVRNLACPSARIDQGVLGVQHTRHGDVPPQVSELLSMQGLRFVVVMVGPNDLGWTDLLRYCYAFEDCNDQLTSGQFDYRLASFDRHYGDLLAALAALPDQPQIIVVGSYDVFSPDAACADTEAPGSYAGLPGLDKDNVELLQDRNQQFNDVLRTGAEAYDFSFATPHLSTLCQEGDPSLGRDIQGLADPYPFHPTAVGMIRVAASVFAKIGDGDVRSQ